LSKGDREGDSDRAATRPHISDAKDPRPVDAGRQRGHHRRDRRIHEQLGLRARDQRASVDGQRDPVEFLDAPQVRDRLTCLAPRDQRLVRRSRVGADRCLTVGDDRGPVDTDRVREQQLGIESRGVGSGSSKALGAGLDERAGRGHARAIRVGW